MSARRSLSDTSSGPLWRLPIGSTKSLGSAKITPTFLKGILRKSRATSALLSGTTVDARRHRGRSRGKHSPHMVNPRSREQSTRSSQSPPWCGSEVRARSHHAVTTTASPHIRSGAWYRPRTIIPHARGHRAQVDGTHLIDGMSRPWLPTVTTPPVSSDTALKVDAADVLDQRLNAGAVCPVC